MGEKLIVGPINKGFRTDREPFVIDNDNFPTLINAYQWRGRLKRKRGTVFLGRLNRFLGTTNGAGNLTVTINPHPIDSGIISVSIGSDLFTDQGGASPVTMITNSTGSAVLNRTTGVLTITGSKLNTNVFYFPGLPVMGLEDLILETQEFATNLAFDTRYSYNLTGAIPSLIYDVSFYKNPALDATNLPGYVRKVTWTPLNWNGANYQQFYTVNYQGALWATNGIKFTNNKPDLTSIGMQFAPAGTITYVSNTPTTLTVTIAGSPLVIGDFVFVNEWTGTNKDTLNFQSGYVTAISPNIIITFPFANIGAGPYTPGIIQYLTNNSDSTLDPIRWYDGDPTDGVHFIPSTANGWVNFSPPLSQLSYSISELPADIYYLVGARMIIPFKDRLLFLGPVVETSKGAKNYLQDTVIYSQNGTAYYTASFTINPTVVSPTTIFHPILVPINQTATASAYFEDQVGFGGFIQAGIDQKLNTIGPNEDSLIAGFDRRQTQIVYTGNDVTPFNFFSINSELGSSSTFSTIVMDEGVLTRGSRGFVFTSRTNARRFDLEIPDQSFEINLLNNGQERITSQRDYINEWIYFTFSRKGSDPAFFIFPNQTLQYNYRDDSWAVFNEAYTTYGTFRPNSGYTWANIGVIYKSWDSWNDPWNAGVTNLEQPVVIAGNQQGFILIRGQGTSEGTSLYIQNVVGVTVTCPNHCLDLGDFITITGALGAAGTILNVGIFEIVSIIDKDNFVINLTTAVNNYIGGGEIIRLYRPFIQTKQFPVSWGMARKTRIGPQQYLLTQADTQSQITLFIFLSQNDVNAFNDPTIITDNGLIYSTVLYTCAESGNLGLTPANTNLLELSVPNTGSNNQNQIWHRINTSLIGDTVQLGFTLSDAQMKDLDENGNFISQFSEIEIHGFILDVSPSQVLA